MITLTGEFQNCRLPKIAFSMNSWDCKSSGYISNNQNKVNRNGSDSGTDKDYDSDNINYNYSHENDNSELLS